jgi:hypothetical protein
VLSHLAGKPDRHSNLSTPPSETLYFFARTLPQGKTIDDLEKLVTTLQCSNVKRPPRGVEVPSVRRRLGPHGIASLVAQYKAGDSLEVVAADHGISTSSARRVLLQEGVVMRLAPISDDVLKRAAEMYATGLGLLPIANELGVVKTTLMRAMKRAGVELRPPKH